VLSLELLSPSSTPEEGGATTEDFMRSIANESIFLSNSPLAISSSLFVIRSLSTFIISPSPHAMIIVMTVTAARICGIILVNLNFFFIITTSQEYRKIHIPYQ